MADDGIEVLEPKIVILTSFLTPVLKNHIKNLGCKHFYDKPIQLEQLKDILMEYETYWLKNLQSVQ